MMMLSGMIDWTGGIAANSRVSGFDASHRLLGACRSVQKVSGFGASLRFIGRVLFGSKS